MLAGIKLNHLHTLFLLRLAMVRRMSEADKQLRDLAVEMLGLVVETLMLKERLVNSGNTIIWKVRGSFPIY